MNIKKLLVLLVALMIYINYQNYMSQDTTKLYHQVLMLEDKIETQKTLSSTQTDSAQDLGAKLHSYFYDGAKQSYSQAMGAMQEQITQSAKDICEEPSINWAQSPQESAEFEKLRINFALRCDASMFNKFIANLKAKDKIYMIENLKISKDERKNHLLVSMQILGYRINR
ncbi:MAG: hypothetical protein J7J31_00255 [Helicobacteraceae bacterium]|nr:hypothetical protein [Helicobacteraceae bacterium]